MSRREDLPADFDEPVFAEPWQAEAFAMTVALHDKGLFSWSEWADALSAEVKRPDAAADRHDYYEHWLAALESLLSAKGVAGRSDVDRLAAAWERAAHATPHGKPILLENDPGPSAGRGQTG
ncbi:MULTISPECIES: nitrile hydratase accessory protein [unclassified Mesorhizobium]|uniref:nitrile hydratase accessory protein n=1 Tax=unclassified Mesorhizobium TaxID=325217 RepID=UPI000FC9EE0D|nr:MULTISPECIES: nitrile hydratase accessory protein [unclassified Mesorhizobium]RUW75618.1 nitrile hydratase accessory protein [Mesorhizobium sp. M4B.F.Ca.ET.049.02.1.2]RVD21000.1 nitrile hydratase accessory protein [Mesorhizobium sp. M4B.F.Ca.ET.017.02.2.1]TGV27074.1 nitrile hydratase accessory protein [Mesorhizobium sp. M4B.F.Ca.ET.143.01.1.1]